MSMIDTVKGKSLDKLSDDELQVLLLELQAPIPKKEKKTGKKAAEKKEAVVDAVLDLLNKDN